MSVFPWGKGDLKDKKPLKWQEDILLSINNKLIHVDEAINIAVASGHGVGKSALVAWLILWSLATRPDTRGVVTANTETQLKTKTWAELAKWFHMSILKDMFTLTATAIFSSDKLRERTWRFDAVPWSEHNTEAFAGLHNQGGRIALIFDEASAIPDIIWEVAEGALTDKDTEIIWLAFGNPTRPSGRFYECFGRFRHRWDTKRIDSRNVSLTNKSQIDKWIADYGEDSDFVKVRVKGEFPSIGESSLISAADAAAAVERLLENPVYKSAPKILGVDVARFGEDSSVIALRQGLKLYNLQKFKGFDTMRIAAAVIASINEYQPDAIFIDEGGVGAGVVDRLKELGFARVYGINFGGKPNNDRKYFNKRAEMWGEMALWLAKADIPNDSELIQDLVSPTYSFRGDNGQIILEKKETMKKRGLASPDCADAVALTFAESVKVNVKPTLTGVLR